MTHLAQDDDACSLAKKQHLHGFLALQIAFLAGRFASFFASGETPVATIFARDNF